MNNTARSSHVSLIFPRRYLQLVRHVGVQRRQIGVQGASFLTLAFRFRRHGDVQLLDFSSRLQVPETEQVALSLAFLRRLPTDHSHRRRALDDADVTWFCKNKIKKNIQNERNPKT